MVHKLRVCFHKDCLRLARGDCSLQRCVSQDSSQLLTHLINQHFYTYPRYPFVEQPPVSRWLCTVFGGENIIVIIVIMNVVSIVIVVILSLCSSLFCLYSLLPQARALTLNGTKCSYGSSNCTMRYIQLLYRYWQQEKLPLWPVRMYHIGR